MARLSSFSRDLQVMVDQTLSPQARSAMIATIARGALAEAQADNQAAIGMVPSHQTFVDGRSSEALDSVDPDRGVIVFAFDVQFDLFEYIGRLLVEHSPALTGRYMKSHRLYADGTEVAAYDPSISAGEWVFTTPLPYARKIESGQSDQAPDGVYQGVAVMAAKRYGNLASIKFSFREVEGGAGRNPAIVVRIR